MENYKTRWDSEEMTTFSGSFSEVFMIAVATFQENTRNSQRIIKVKVRSNG